MDIITRLETARERTLGYFDLSGEQLERSYAPGKWPVKCLLHHLADAETVMYDRIRRTISEPRQVLWAFDQDKWATGLDYRQMPLELSRRIYEAVRGGVIYQARLNYEHNGLREFVHSETGVRTLKDEFDKVAWHNEHHLAQIEMALKIRKNSTIFLALPRLHRWMDEMLTAGQMKGDQDARISEAIRLEWARLRNFIRKRVMDAGDAEDILQDVFYELIEAYRLTKPVEQVGAWLFRVARNRITDRFRKKRTEESGEAPGWEDLLPSKEGGPEAVYARGVLLEELELALEELPDEQREVFVAHELEGRSFKEISAETGVSVNTLLSRKHYAVLHLRRRLQAIYEEFRDK